MTKMRVLDERCEDKRSSLLVEEYEAVSVQFVRWISRIHMLLGGDLQSCARGASGWGWRWARTTDRACFVDVDTAVATQKEILDREC